MELIEGAVGGEVVLREDDVVSERRPEDGALVLGGVVLGEGGLASRLLIVSGYCFIALSGKMPDFALWSTVSLMSVA